MNMINIESRRATAQKESEWEKPVVKLHGEELHPCTGTSALVAVSSRHFVGKGCASDDANA